MKLSCYLSVAAGLLLLGNAPSQAGCGQTTATITNLPAIPLSGFQVNGLNATGQLTGFFYVSLDHPSHAFLYDAGNLIDFGTLGGDTSSGRAINDAGQIAGQADMTGNTATDVALFSDGKPTDLGTLGGTFGTGLAINGQGQVAGYSYPTNSTTSVAFLYSKGQIVSLGTLSGGYSSAFALNSNGVVVGESSLDTGDIHGIVYANGNLNDLSTLGGSYSSAFAINDAGVIVGESDTATGETHGFVNSGGMMDIGTLGGSYSSAYAINETGQIMGLSRTTDDLQYHGFIGTAGALTDLGTLGGNYSYANALNDLGQVTGESATADGVAHAFLWQNGQMVDLNSLLPTNSGWELNSGWFINNAGRIVGVGSLDGISQWFIMDVSTGDKAPAADAGSDQIVDCQNQATLNGSGSTDPDGDSLSYQWSLQGVVLGTTPVLAVYLPLGTNVVTLTVTDPCGGSGQTNVSVVVRDTTPPTVAGPAPLTVAADAHCQALVPSVLPNVLAHDNCTAVDELVLSQSPAAGTVVGSGQYTIVVSAKDEAGNVGTANVKLNVVDTTAPTIISVPAPRVVAAGANCLGAVPNILPNVVATDNCTPANQLVLSQSPTAGTVVAIGQYPITVTVTDANGNSSATTVSMQVADMTAPAILSLPAPITIPAKNCQGMVPNVLSNVVASDNCTPATQLVLVQSPAPGTIVATGQHPITVTVTDAAGNSSVGVVSFLVADNSRPALHTPGPITLSADAAGQAAVPNVLPDVVVTDNCTPADELALSQSPAAGTRLGPGNYQISVTVTDLSGNSSTANVHLKVVDTTPPAIVSAPGPITLPVDSNCQGAVPDVLAGIVATDNCTPAGQLVITQKPAAGTLKGIGTHTITFTVTDAAGNKSTGSISFTVVDLVPPVIVSTPAPITLSADGNGQASVPNVLRDIVAEDNCTAAARLAMTQTPAAGTLLPPGQYTISVTVADASGNSSSTTVGLTIADTTAPVIHSLSVSPNVLSPPDGRLVPVTVSAAVSDNCDSAPVTKIVSITSSTPAAPGDIQITGNLTAMLAASKGPGGTARVYTLTVQSTDASGNHANDTVKVALAKR